MQFVLPVPILRLPHADQRSTPLPAYASQNAAGLDLHASLDGPETIPPGAVAKIPTGHALAIPVGHEGQVRPRSGLSTRHRVLVPNGPGTVDADYRGELIVALLNLGDGPYVVQPNDRVAQLVVVPLPRVALEPVSELPATGRDAGGFGSTGV